MKQNITKNKLQKTSAAQNAAQYEIERKVTEQKAMIAANSKATLIYSDSIGSVSTPWTDFTIEYIDPQYPEAKYRSVLSFVCTLPDFPMDKIGNIDVRCELRNITADDLSWYTYAGHCCFINDNPGNTLFGTNKTVTLQAWLVLDWVENISLQGRFHISFK